MERFLVLFLFLFFLFFLNSQKNTEICRVAPPVRTTVVLCAQISLLTLPQELHRCVIRIQGRKCWKGKPSLPVNVLATRAMRQVRQEHEIVLLPYVLCVRFANPHGLGTLLNDMGFSISWSK